ncbi:hypothetical protein AXG93_1712s1230 [Marchantia polymorpha subsp. ruderalis]|uniref:Non-haem dioxygenase N-terminal domain-containing protein n=1 Tax=Marchantia polymorpha subsp. ruderalis TaxID=1480154 RepID=A0A176VYR8_MARPO|nr:hypothetical protein AXG93_1712s1230 [Marchantia polymorpha subsp. ruderalis]
MLVQNYSTVPFSHRCKAFTAHRSSASQSKLGREFSDVQSHSARASAVSKCERISMSEDLLRSRSYPALRRSTFQRPEARISSSSINSASENAAESNGTTGQQESLEVLDMESYFSGRDERLEFCRKLREQCHKVGFFYVKNHGVSEELCDSMLEMGRKFFDLPVELKMQLDYTNSSQFRGYMRIGVENTAGVTDFREQIEFGPEEAEDIDIVDGMENKLVYPLYRRLRGPNQWPPEDDLPDFRREAELFIDQMNEVSMHLMQALALSLGLQKDFFDSTFKYMPHYQMKIAKYPPNPASDGAEGIGMFGVGAHSDSGFLSLLLQDDIGGLQASSCSHYIRCSLMNLDKPKGTYNSWKVD